MRILLLSGFSVAFVLLASNQTAWAQAAHGVFKVVKGDVEVTSSGETKKARIGMKVLPKDKIKAGKDSRAKIVMVDKNEININPDSQIEIEEYEFKPESGKKDVLINVLYGKMRAKVEQKYEGDNKFQVKTKSAVAGVRGTDFFTSYNRSTGATRIVTFHGRVQFGLPGPGGQILNPVMVGVGQSSSSTAGAPPGAPVFVPQSELANFDSSSGVDLNGGPGGSDSTGRDPSANDGSNQQEGPGKDEPTGSNQREDGGANGGNSNPGDGPKGPVAGGQGPNADDRGPASVGPAGGPGPALGGPMLLPGDTMSGPSGGLVQPVMPGIPGLPGYAGGGMMPNLPFIPEIPKCDFCQDIIQNGSRNLIINVQHNN